MEVIIREARREDFEAVLALVLELRAHSGSEGGVDRDGVRAIFERSLGKDDVYIRVADRGGEVVGLLDLTVHSSLYHHLPYAFIDEIVVKAGQRGKGIGRLLLDQAFTLARERGCNGVCLDTSASNESALRFYRAYGFDSESIMLEKEFS